MQIFLTYDRKHDTDVHKRLMRNRDLKCFQTDLKYSADRKNELKYFKKVLMLIINTNNKTQRNNRRCKMRYA